jgi:hypothetical protein
VVPALVLARSGELCHADVTRIEWADQSPDAASLPGCVPSLEENAQRWAKFAVPDQAGKLKAQGEHSPLGFLELGLALGLAQLEAEICVT